jgi:SWI/SNF-related matrix-associated actin-dependent regulator 1 of chromatin subfamily A
MSELKPFPYQEEGIEYGLQNKRFILGDSPGLGKTVQSIQTVVRANAFPCLVIAPASLKINWQREWHMWSDKKAMILNNANQHSWWMFSKPELNPFGTGAKVDAFITNYESLKKFFVAEVPRGELRLKNIRFKPQISIFKSVIIDEAHRLKDPSTQQSKFSKGIVTGKEFILALTGTPIVNTQEDLVSILGVLDRLKDFGGASMFRAKWLNKEKLPELGERMKETCFIRRRKSEVLKDLPPKLRSIFPVELTNQEEYDHALNDLKSYLIEYKQKTNAEAARLVRMKALVQIGILKGISARGKLATVIEQVREVINAGEKIILFCHLKEIGQALKEAFPDACVIRGGMAGHMKQANIDRFQKDPEARVIICSIKAAGVGITLTASSRVGFVELPWHPADLDQCEDRAHRIGQKDSVQCTYFLGQGSIDNHIYRIINRKREISNLVTGDHDEIEVKIQNELFETLLKEVS